MVSILVLMEVLREAKLNADTQLLLQCFNPCFNGSVERGAEKVRKSNGHVPVSILVLMEVLREAMDDIHGNGESHEFQSLF